jgi:2-amino-4-hydroxy-6-hydroxymethyldihydropteridine diphosphokinase
MAWPDSQGTGAPETIAYVGLGSNLGEPCDQVLAALEELANLPGCTLLARSSLYATTPVGPIPQPDYVNAAAALSTRLSPLGLLAALQGVEQSHGRERDGPRWGPRTLDLDLLIYGRQQLRQPGLELPHPEIHRRAFVLVPLAQIAPERLEIPGLGQLADLLAACPADPRMRRIPEDASRAGKPSVPALSCPPA